MQNYSQVFVDTLAEFESLIVPGDQGDAGKGQVLVRAGYKIFSTLDPDVGYIGKSPGQTQFAGVAVDALTDRSDGTGADFLTDILQADGTRLIAVAYTPYPHANVPPDYGWVEPTADYLAIPGPLVLKNDTDPYPPDPEDAVTLDDLNATLEMHSEMLGRIESNQGIAAEQEAANTAEILGRIDSFEERFNQIVEDVEESLRKAGLFVFFRRRPDPPPE